MVVDKVTSIMSGIVLLIVSAIILVLLGLVFFAVNLWIVNYAVHLLGLEVAGDWVVLSAALLSAASMIGSRWR